MLRAPSAALRPFVSSVWFHHAVTNLPTASEHVAPCGEMHLVFRIGGSRLRIRDAAGNACEPGSAIVGGMRSGYYVKEASPAESVGVQLRPGAAEAVLGVPAEALAGRHWALEELWGSAAESLCARLAEAPDGESRARILEGFLLARVGRARGMHPAVAQALAGFDPATSVRSLVQRSGYSHRTFISQFRRSVGLAPKAYARVLRFNRMLRHLAANPAITWADLAMEGGYSDQPHFNREFREFSGVTPEAYRAIAPASAHHIPVNSFQDAALFRR